MPTKYFMVRVDVELLADLDIVGVLVGFKIQEGINLIIVILVNIYLVDAHLSIIISVDSVEVNLVD